MVVAMPLKLKSGTQTTHADDAHHGSERREVLGRTRP